MFYRGLASFEVLQTEPLIRINKANERLCLLFKLGDAAA